MARVQYKELKKGDKIIVYGDKFIIKKIEFSGKGLKKGKEKCRIEAKNEKSAEQKVIIRLANEYVEKA